MINWRQTQKPMHEAVDPANPLKRDGEFVPDDPKLTRMANLLRYMRGTPAYMPPNKWPEGMMLFGIDHESRLCCAFFMLIGQFEEIPTPELFGLCNPNTKTIYFVPALNMPGSNVEAQAQIHKWITGMKDDQLSLTIQYLETNGWKVERSDFTTEEKGSRMS